MLVVSLKCVDMLNALPITCLLVSIGYSINTIAEDYQILHSWGIILLSLTLKLFLSLLKLLQ